jgi:hypothetical protein
MGILSIQELQTEQNQLARLRFVYYFSQKLKASKPGAILLRKVIA